MFMRSSLVLKSAGVCSLALIVFGAVSVRSRDANNVSSLESGLPTLITASETTPQPMARKARAEVEDGLSRIAESQA